MEGVELVSVHRVNVTILKSRQPLGPSAQDGDAVRVCVCVCVWEGGDYFIHLSFSVHPNSSMYATGKCGTKVTYLQEQQTELRTILNLECFSPKQSPTDPPPACANTRLQGAMATAPSPELVHTVPQYVGGGDEGRPVVQYHCGTHGQGTHQPVPHHPASLETNENNTKDYQR